MKTCVQWRRVLPACACSNAGPYLGPRQLLEDVVDHITYLVFKALDGHTALCRAREGLPEDLVHEKLGTQRMESPPTLPCRWLTCVYLNRGICPSP